MGNHIGEEHGCYKIIGESDLKTNDGHIIYECQCKHCHNIFKMPRSSLLYFKSDKCTHYITIGNITIPSGNLNSPFSNNRIAKIFQGMLRRCYDENDKDYRYYGEKGIRVSQQWIDSPVLFEEWSLNNGYKDNLTIDRINESNNYCPDNCRWILIEENARFKSNTNYITATVTLSGRQWASLIPSVGVNRINRMIKEQGLEKTQKYIENKLCDKHNLLNI